MIAGSSSHRVQRVASLIRSEISRLLVSEIADPRLRHIIITNVEVTKDLRYARIQFESIDGAAEKEIMKGLGKAGHFLRKKLGANLDLRYVPELRFESDKHGSQLDRVLSLLDEVKQS